MTILFYTPREKPYGCFSNFSWHGFDLEGYWWPTNEHYFQAQKFLGHSFMYEIREAKTPKEAAAMGRNRQYPLRNDWETIKDEIMLRGVYRKFTLHVEIRQILLETQEELIIENSPIDYYWGCGADGTGHNKLGKILMKVREILKNQ